MPNDGYTVSEMAERAKRTRHAVEQWLSNHGIKPISYEARYPKSALKLLLDSKPGRPKKPAPKAPKKPRKTP